MKRRILLCTFGSLGDLHPIIAVARELQSRGHHATIATAESYRKRVENAGVAYHAVRPDIPDLHEDREKIRKVIEAGGTEVLFKEIIVPAVRDGYADILPLARESDLVITRSMVPAASLAARKLDKKWMPAILTPLPLWSIYDPPATPSFCAPRRFKAIRAHPWFQKLVRHKVRSVVASWSQPVLEFARELGLKQEGSFTLGQFSPHGNLALFSRVLAQPQKDWPRPTNVCGHCFYDDAHKEGLPGELLEFLKNGEAPVLFTFSSGGPFGAGEYFSHSMSACRRLGRRGLLLIGAEENRPADLAPGDTQVVAFPYAPFSALMPHVSAVVHNGGIGTACETLRAGLPALIMPCAHDQPDIAGRIERLGAARTISREDYSAEKTAHELNLLLSDSSYRHRAKELAVEMQKENGPATAAEEIERVLENS